jgi:hypothetical protein
MADQPDALFGVNFEVIMRQGNLITAQIPTLDKDLLTLKLHGFDDGGIWVENQKLTDMVLKILGESSLPNTPIFFVPYSSIRFAFVAVEGQSLSAEKLGL